MRTSSIGRPGSRAKWVALIATLAVGVAAVTLHIRHRHEESALLRADPDTVLEDAALARTAFDIGRPAFNRWCAGCHGGNGTGNRLKAAPDLTGGGHLYGAGRPDEIEQIVLYGIRAGTSRGKNLASMPAFGRPKPYAGEPIPPLEPAAIADVTQFVLSLSGRAEDRDATRRGRVIYNGRGGCYDCHGGDGGGDPAIGAPGFTGPAWLYGDGAAQSIAASIAYGRAGICPAFASRVTPVEARAIAIYVASLVR